MSSFRRFVACLAAPLFLGSTPGCDWNAPVAPTREQTLKSDAKTQDSMRKYYGNMLKPQSKPQAKSKSKSGH